MTHKPHALHLFIPLLLGTAGVATAQIDVFKDNNPTSLVNGTSWVGGVAPGISDTAVFDDTYAEIGNLGTGAPLNYAGLRVAGTTVTTAVIINNTTYDNYVGTGTAGVDMSGSPRDLQIVGFVSNSNQTWNIGAGSTFTVGGTRFSGNGDVDITGSGTVILNADNGAAAYGGNLSVSGGTLQLNALEAGNVVVNDGATLVSEVFLPGNLALGSSTGATLVIDPASAGALNAGDLVLTGTNTVQLTGAPGTPGVVDVVAYQTITGDETNFALDPAVAAKLRNAPVFADTLSAITLEFFAGDSLTWTGTTDGDWDIDATANWDNGGATNYFDLDAVTFGNTAATMSVTVTEDVSPAATMFVNTAGNDYTIGGPGAIGGSGGLSLAGGGTVTLTNTNTFTGATTIDAGTLVVDITAGDPLAETSGVAVNAPGTLRIVHDDAGFDLTDGFLSGDGTVAINPHATVGSADNHNVTATGDNSAFTGSLVLEAPMSGTWRINQPAALALGGASITVENGAQLWAGNATYSSPITLTGDGFADADGPLGALRLIPSSSISGGTQWAGPVTITGTPGDSGGTVSDASIGFNAPASGSRYASVNGAVTGGDLAVVGYSANGNEWIRLNNANSYGDSIVRPNDLATAGQTALMIGGPTNTTATLGTGDVHLVGGAAGKVASLRVQRDDGYTLPGDVLSGGNTAATRLLVDTTGTGLSTGGRTITIGEELRISPNNNNSILNIDPGSVVTCGNLNVGNTSGRPGTLNMTGGILNVLGTFNAGPGGTGFINLDGGTVNVSSSGIAGTAGSEFNLGGSTLVAGGSFSSDMPVNVTAASTIDIDGNFVQLLEGIIGSGDLELADTTTGGTLFLTYNQDSSYDGSLSGSATVSKIGSALLTLGGASTHSGDFFVDEGGLMITGSLSNPNLSFDGGALHTGGALTGNLSVGALAPSSLEYKGSPLAVTGDVTLTDINEVNPFAAGTLPAGTYPLATYTGTLTGGAANLSLPAGFVPGNYRQTYSFATDADSVDLVVTGSTASVVWDGSVSTTWDINSSTAWDGGSGVFYNLDDAVFDDTATGGTTVNIAGSVEPGSVKVNNDTLTYTFNGIGSIDGETSLLKQGPGTLNINTSNGYTGGTTIEGGTVVAGAASSVNGPVLIDGGQLTVDILNGLGSGTVTISEGKLRVNVKNAVTNNLVLGDTNSGTAETVLEYELASANSLNMPTVVSGDAPNSKAIIRVIGPGGVGGQSATYFHGTILLENRDLYHDNAAGRIGGLAGKISGTGDLHITDTPGTGNNRTRLLNNNNDFVGDVYADGTGWLQIGTGAAFGTITCIPLGSDLHVAADARVSATGGNVSTVGGLFGSGLVDMNVSGGGSTTRLTVGNADKSGVFSGVMKNLNTTKFLALTKTGAGTQELNGECTFTGSTIVNGGLLVINTADPMTPYASNITVQADATLGGNAVLDGNLTATAANATVAPGTSTGTISVAGNANLAGGTLSIEIDDATTPKNDRIDVTGTLSIDGGTLDVSVSGAAAESVYLIATYGALSGAFAVENIPAGYSLDTSFLGANEIVLVAGVLDDYSSWAIGHGLNPASNGAPGADPDGDGIDNEGEYAFGLDPTSGASVSAITVPLDKTAGTFTYTRRKTSLTMLSYSYEWSTTLDGSWTTVVPAGAPTVTPIPATDNEKVEVDLTGAPGDPLANTKLFIRVVAQ